MSNLKSFTTYEQLREDLCLIKRNYYQSKFNEMDVEERNFIWTDLSLLKKDKQIEKVGTICYKTSPFIEKYIFDKEWFVIYYEENHKIVIKEVFDTKNFEKKSINEYKVKTKKIR